MSTPTIVSRVQRVRHEIRRRDLQVVRVASISPHFKSITFASASLADFNSASFDDHIKLLLDVGDAEPVRRDYTPRHFEARAGKLTLEFDLHGDGPAAQWAAQAIPGKRATIAGPRGSFIIPMDYDWHLLVGDDTATPAIARRLEELPCGAHAIVILQMPRAQDRRSFTSAADVQLQWASDTNELLQAARTLALPEGEGYAWYAGEATAMGALRKILVNEKGHDRHAIRAAAYWKLGAVVHHETIED